MNMMLFREPRIHNERHLDFIRSLPCIVCQDNTSTEAAHIRMKDPSILKRQAGMQEKPHDVFTLPLCNECHAKQHRMNEEKFWLWVGVDPIKVALALWFWKDNRPKCEEILQARS